MLPRVTTALAIVLLALFSSPLWAQSESTLSTTDATALRLEADSEGQYALPRTTGPPVPLRFEAGASDISLHRLELNPTTGLLEATLQSTGATAVSAWTVSIRSFAADGTLLSEQRRTQDWAGGADGRPSEQSKAAHTVPPVHGQGLLYPGQLARIELGALPTVPSDKSPVDHLLLTVAMTLRDESSYTGDARLARRVLAMRTASAEERTYWLERLRKVLTKAGSPEEAITAVETLLEDLHAASDAAPPAAVAARNTIATNLQGSLESAQRDPDHALSIFRELANWMEVQIDKALPFVSDELPLEAPPSGSVEEKADEDPGVPDETINCDCGGSMNAVSTKNISERCTDSSHSITVRPR